MILTTRAAGLTTRIRDLAGRISSDYLLHAY